MRCRRPILACAAALAVAGCGLPAGPPPEPRNLPFELGVNYVNVDLSASEARRIAATGARFARINFDYARRAAVAKADRWEYLDGRVAALAEAGVRVLPVITGEPAAFPATASKRATFDSIVGEMVERYGHRGSLWRGHDAPPRLPIRAWQVWNEPNGRFSGKLSPNAYAAVLTDAAGLIRRIDRDAMVVTAGMACHSKQSTTRYIEAVLRAAQGYDAVAIHPFGETLDAVTRCLDHAKAAAAAAASPGEAPLPVWVTEVGWCTSGHGQPYSASPGRQVDLLREALDLLKARAGDYDLELVAWFAWRDAPNGRWDGECGLEDSEGDPKPALRAFTGAASKEAPPSR